MKTISPHAVRFLVTSSLALSLPDAGRSLQWRSHLAGPEGPQRASAAGLTAVPLPHRSRLLEVLERRHQEERQRLALRLEQLEDRLADLAAAESFDGRAARRLAEEHAQVCHALEERERRHRSRFWARNGDRPRQEHGHVTVAWEHGLA